MLQLLVGTGAGESTGSVCFKRHRPEQTLLYRLIEQYYPEFEMQWASEGRVLPDYVRREFDENLKCGRLEVFSVSATPRELMFHDAFCPMFFGRPESPILSLVSNIDYSWPESNRNQRPRMMAMPPGASVRTNKRRA